MNLENNAKSNGPVPETKTGTQTKNRYPAHSTAAKTKLLTVCKKCGKQNGNGYQYCTACHKAHKNTGGKKVTTRAVVVSPVATKSLQLGSPKRGVGCKTKVLPPVDRSELFRIGGTEL